MIKIWKQILLGSGVAGVVADISDIQQAGAHGHARRHPIVKRGADRATAPQPLLTGLRQPVVARQKVRRLDPAGQKDIDSL